jgi:type I restriction enzyme S subunit
MKQGWEIKSLSEIGKVYNGNSINEKVKKDNYTDLEDGFPFIATKDISYESEIDYDNGIKIPFEEKSSFKTAPKNTVLICAEGGSAGRKIGFTNQEVCFGNKLFALAVNKNVESRYVYYYYFSSTFQNHFASELAGIIGGVSMNKFKDIEIPLPPYTEQQRIVAILDEAFTAIAKAKANAEQNLNNVKELFESFLQGVFETKGEGWEEKCFDEVCEISSKLIDPKLKEFQNLIHIGAGNIESKKGTLVDLKTAKEENLISGKFLFDETMVLYSKIRPYLVKVVKCDFNGLCSADIYPLVPFKNIMIKEFLYYLLISQNFTEYAIKGSQRAGMPKVNRNHLFAYTFNLPPLKEQQTIVQKLDALSTHTKKLEIIYQQKINDLEELKKSVLQKAFSGELKAKEKVAV